MFDAAYQQVTCADCGREYVCLPHDDYYRRPDTPPEEHSATSGVCESCLLTPRGITRVIDTRPVNN